MKKLNIIIADGHTLIRQPAYVKKIIKKRASGYITKSSSQDKILKTITGIFSGKRYICKEIRDILSNQIISNQDESKGINSLSQRELAIIGLIKQGLLQKKLQRAFPSLLKRLRFIGTIYKRLQFRNTPALISYVT